MSTMTIGTLAKAAGVHVETVRYYERRGLLPRPRRTAAGYRMFEEDAVRRLRFVKRAQSLGFSLHEIRELLSLRIGGRVDCSAVRAKATKKVAAIEQKIRALQAMRKALLRLIDECEHRPAASPACPILDSLEFSEESDAA